MIQPVNSSLKRGAPSLSPAVFLDRDGTIIEDRGDLRHPSQVVFFRETADALRRLGERFHLFIVTQQSGVARGILSMGDVESVNRHVISHLEEAGVRIVKTYVCPHERSDGCRCMKPNPYFLMEAERHYAIDLKRSFVIGDHPHDVDLAINAGAAGIYVLSGHGAKHREEIAGEILVAEGIREAADIILGYGDNA